MSLRKFNISVQDYISVRCDNISVCRLVPAFKKSKLLPSAQCHIPKHNHYDTNAVRTSNPTKSNSTDLFKLLSLGPSFK